MGKEGGILQKPDFRGGENQQKRLRLSNVGWASASHRSEDGSWRPLSLDGMRAGLQTFSDLASLCSLEVCPSGS